MKQRYKVKIAGGIDLGGRIIPVGQTFDPRIEFEDWAERAVKSGALERITSPAPESKKKNPEINR